VFIEIVLKSVPTAANSNHYVIAEDSNKNNVFGVSNSVFALADLDNRKLHLARASVSN